MTQVLISSDVPHYLGVGLEPEWAETEGKNQSINHQDEVYYF